MQNGKKLPTYKETAFMNIIRKRIFAKVTRNRPLSPPEQIFDLQSLEEVKKIMNNKQQ